MEAKYIAVICAGCVLFLLLVALFIYFSNNGIKVTKYNLKDSGVREEGVRIVHLSDLHGKSFGKNNCRLIKKVKACSPDIIAITGDIIHKYRQRDIKIAINLVASLKDIAPVYYVSGNHEMRSKNYRTFRQSLQGAGACVLDDCSRDICGLTLFGVNCASIKKGAYFKDLQGDKLNVLLAHLPQYITRYSAAGYNVALCGHAHGGQWRIPFTKVGIYSPGQGLFPKLTSGVHRCGNLNEVISRGLGNSECPIRLFNRPEIVVVNLIKQ